MGLRRSGSETIQHQIAEYRIGADQSATVPSDTNGIVTDGGVVPWLVCPNDQSDHRAFCYRGVPFAQAQAAIRHPSASLRSATVNTAPDCVTCLPRTLNVMVAGTTT